MQRLSIQNITLLQNALLKGELNEAKRLIEEEKTSLHWRLLNGDTPLHAAVRTEVVKLVIESATSDTLINYTNDDKQSAKETNTCYCQKSH